MGAVHHKVSPSTMSGVPSQGAQTMRLTMRLLGLQDRPYHINLYLDRCLITAVPRSSQELYFAKLQIKHRFLKVLIIFKRTMCREVDLGKMKQGYDRLELSMR